MTQLAHSWCMVGAKFFMCELALPCITIYEYFWRTTASNVFLSLSLSVTVSSVSSSFCSYSHRITLLHFIFILMYIISFNFLQNCIYFLILLFIFIFLFASCPLYVCNFIDSLFHTPYLSVLPVSSFYYCMGFFNPPWFGLLPSTFYS